MSEQQKTGILFTLFGGTILLVLIGFGYFMLGRGMISSRERDTKKLKTEIVELNTQLTEIKKLMSEKEELDKQAETIAKVTRRLPSSPDAPGFLGALVTILGTTGIIQEEVKPDATSSNPGDLYTEIPYRIKAYGHFHSFGQFLMLLEQNPDRFMRIKNLTISNNLERPSIHPIEMEIATFMFNK